MEIYIMKKQIIAAAVAASMSAVAIADVAITGDAKYEFDATDANGANTTTSNTEVNLSIKGKTGDTGVVANLEFNTHGNDASGAIDVEDLYMTTKVADIAVKAGNWATGTSALLGEIDNGGRSTNKIDLRTSLSGITVYAGNSGAETGTGDTQLNGNMYAGIVLSDVAGQKIEIKKNSQTLNSAGIQGKLAGVSYRVEQADHDTEGTTTFAQVATELSGLKLNYSVLDADNAAALDEDDSSLFAISTGTAANATATGQKQVWVSTGIDGTTVDLKVGTVENGLDATTDRDYSQIKATRKLASGANAVITYTDQDLAVGDQQNLEIELNVSF